jgi:ribosomal protein S18 acetylase RimI-like enzyme
MPMQERQALPKIERDTTTHFQVERWKPNDVPAIVHLEELCWAPWLRKPADNIGTIASLFPETQLVAKNHNNVIVAAITANRINWDGNPQSLQTWDSVAGGSENASDYIATHVLDGNTICITSSAVDPSVQRKGLAKRLIMEMKDVGKELGVDHLIGPFRPSEYGNYKIAQGPNSNVSFAEYCELKQEDGQSLDPWLRSAAKLGMKPMRVEEASMVVEVSMNKFEEYRKSYNSNKWVDFGNGRWECGDTGSWYLNLEQEKATYIEPNLWGEIPLK